MRNTSLFVKMLVLGLFLSLTTAFAQSANKIILGNLKNGTNVSFSCLSDKTWGIEVYEKNSVYMQQQKPAQIEVFQSKRNTYQLASGYQSVKKGPDRIIAKAKIKSQGNAVFSIEDQWKFSNDVLTLKRKVTISGTEDSTGFYSAMRLTTQPSKKWNETDYLIPGILYGKPHTRANAAGGNMYYDAKHFSIREDYLSAPLIALSFSDKSWAALLNFSPDGATTMEETTAQVSTPIIDEHLKFGALDIQEKSTGGIEMGFLFPGTTNEFAGGMRMREDGNAKPAVRLRYNPVKDGFSQSYSIGFRFGKSDSFYTLEKEVWRWAWKSLNPTIKPVDVEVVRRTLIDHLADRVLVADDRAGIPFVIDAVTGNPGSYRPKLRSFPLGQGDVSPEILDLAKWAKTIGVDMDVKAAELNLWPMIVMGFCGKHIELGEQFLMEGDRDNTARGKKLRALGLKVLESLVHYIPMSPYPAGEAYNLRTGKAGSARTEGAFGLRPLSEDMRMMMDIIHREKKLGREHPEWLNWAKAYADWLLTQQRKDGSFPMNWKKGVVTDSAGSCTYASIPFLVKMTEQTLDNKYLEAAKRAGSYVWNRTGKHCYYLGATGTSTVADKESGMLSMEAFLALYENTKDSRWLAYAKSAGDYTESWIWIWNVPMPIGANYSDLGWKPGVPTIGVNGIGSDDIGGVDQYLDWAVPSFARLYKYTGDKHYLDVAYILLHGTKAMLALPGRSYDLLGPGWQQEHWRMGPIRGIGAHRTWLPWISINHLHGITGLEEFDKDLFLRLSKSIQQ